MSNAIIEAVSREVDVSARKLTALTERIDQQCAKICGVIWRKRCDMPKKKLLTETRRLGNDCGMQDESLMRQLFKLDQVTGDDEIRARRRAEVVRIKDLITVAEKLRQRAIRLERRLHRTKRDIQYAVPEVEMKQASPVAQAEARVNAVVEQLAPEAKSPTPPEQPELQQQQQPARAVSPARDTQQPQQPRSRPTTPEKKPQSQSRPSSPAQPRSASPQSPASPATPPEKPAADTRARASSQSKESVPPAAVATAESSTPSKEIKGAAQPTAAVSEPSKPAAAVKPAVDFKTKYGRLPQWQPVFREQDGADFVLLMADLDGVEAEDIAIGFNDGTLTVKGVKKPTREDLAYQRSPWFAAREPQYGWFERSFAIPASLAGDQAKAEFNDGVLKIKLPKRPAAQPRARPATASSAASHHRPRFSANAMQDVDDEDEDAEMLDAPAVRRFHPQQTRPASAYAHPYANYGYPNSYGYGHPSYGLQRPSSAYGRPAGYGSPFGGLFDAW